MVYSEYKRVNRKRVCLICGKPDWCSFTPDEKISFCARITQDANRISRTGWGVFYHDKSFSESRRLPCTPKSSPKKPELAPIEIRDFAYRKLIELATAADSEEIINGPKGLQARKILDFEHYGSLPQSHLERNKIAKKIRCLINKNFPDYVRKRKSNIAGLPDFWIDKGGKIQIGIEKDYFCPVMVIPYLDVNGFVRACQIRFMRRSAFKSNNKYAWLSTPDKNSGLSCGSPLHFPRGFKDNYISSNPILVTEGALKAQTIQTLYPEADVIANGGVTCSHSEIIINSRFRPLYIGFDADFRHNQCVARAFANLTSVRHKNQFRTKSFLK